MSKPDWKGAPEWANWLAMDEDGLWFWHEEEPRMGSESWESQARVQCMAYPENWQETLISIRERKEECSRG